MTPSTEGLIIPNHIAIICDGNRRWAKKRGLPSLMGHKYGFDALNKLIKYAREIGVHTMTLWGFSTENWNRSKEEVDYLMKLFEDNIVGENLEEAKKSEAKIIHLGRKDRFPESLRRKLIQVEEETKKFTKHILNMALDYGGHDELLRAVKSFVEDHDNNEVSIDKIYEENGKYQDKYPYFGFTQYLDTANQPYPYPDLVIRTGGEQRLSGFLPWQAAYSELYFPKLFLPEFTPNDLLDAIKDYSTRDRRFGGNTKASPGDYSQKK